jgi:hypothetical protein
MEKKTWHHFDGTPRLPQILVHLSHAIVYIQILLPMLIQLTTTHSVVEE